MSTARITVPGTVRPDGTLDLESSVALPPGPVRVTIEPVSRPEDARTGRGLAEVLDAIQTSQLARGFLGTSAQEWEGGRHQRRVEDEEDERRWRTIWGQTVSGPPPEGSVRCSPISTA